MKMLLILGAGGHAAVVADAANAAGWALNGCLDDQPEPEHEDPLTPRRLGSIDDLAAVLKTQPSLTAAHAAVGDAALRRAWLTRAEEAGATLATIIHPTALVAASVTIEAGVFIGPRAVINAGAHVGQGVIVNTGAIVEHGCTLGPFSHVAPGAVLGGDVTVEADGLVGIGATVLPGIRIGEGAVLGAGAVAVTDIPAGVQAVGVPARTP